MTLIDKKLSQKDETTTIANGYTHVVLPSGSAYQSKRISTDNRIKAENAEKTVKVIFENSDLSSFILHVTHTKNTQDVQFLLKNPSGVIQDTSSIARVIDEYNVEIDFGGDIESGNWTLLLIFWNL